MEDMRYSANMVGCKENSANQIGLADSSMDLEKEMVVMTSSEMGVEIDFATYYIVEAEKKKSGLKTYLIALVSIGDAS